MNDYAFGEKIYNLRKEAKMSQKQLAQQLQVTNKAVSKWESGSAKPSLNLLMKLCEIFHVSLDSLMNDSAKACGKKVFKIVLTGGPCSGKSTALNWLQNEFTKRGFLVVFVPETATELLLGGISPVDVGDLNFETSILQLQLEKEKIFEEIANKSSKEKILIVCDRGCLDCKAYMSKSEFSHALSKLQKSEIELRDEYDAVFHLVTAAKGAEEFYDFNNKARQESVEEAVEKDAQTLAAWVGHPHLRVIDNSTDFENKMKRLIGEISACLGEPEPYEIERKFLIEMPNLKKLEALENCEKVEIIQTYLKSDDQKEVRVRQRGCNGSFIYTKTTKTKISPLKRIETEKRISKDKYLALLLEADTSKSQIRKTRYCLVFKNQYYEIDVYPFWKDKAIMEIELSDENQEVVLPNFVKVIREVTGEREFSNFQIAASNLF